MDEARVTERGCCLKSFFAAAAVLIGLMDCWRHFPLVKGDSFTGGVCRGREIVRVKSVSAVRSD